MMKRWWRCLTSGPGLLGWVLCIPGAAAAAHAGGDAYDFDYRISGDNPARPVQVFGDAERTYFQFVAGRAIPLILAGAARERVVPVAEGPYHVVTGRSGEYTLRLTGRQARVEHAGRVWQASAPEAPPSAASRKLGAEDRTLSSYATPVRGDIIEWVEPERRVEHSVVFPPGSGRVPAIHRERIEKVSTQLGPDVRVELHLADGGPSRVLAESRQRGVLQALVHAGVAAERIESVVTSGRTPPIDILHIVWRAPGGPTVHEAAGGTPAGRDIGSMGRPLRGNFDILLSDGNVATSLRRWAQASGYRLEWESPIDAPVVGDLTLETRRFPDAVDRIVTGLRASGYPLRVETEEGRVVRIRHDPPR